MATRREHLQERLRTAVEAAKSQPYGTRGHRHSKRAARRIAGKIRELDHREKP